MVGGIAWCRRLWRWESLGAGGSERGADAPAGGDGDAGLDGDIFDGDVGGVEQKLLPLEDGHLVVERAR